MTTPTPISKHRPQQSEDQTAFTAKDDLVNVPLLINSAKTAKGKLGVFWIVEATRQDNQEHVVFTGSKVIDQLMSACKESNAFPVGAMLAKVEADNPQGYYWDLVDPPSNGAPEDRVAVVKSYIDGGFVSQVEVVEMVENIGGKGSKVNGLSPDQWVALVGRLSELKNSIPSEPPF